ncbi:MAG: hypothetical protein U0M02_07150 [Acutalibacteraceae bacterium]|nr:hypothetical protein [Acutalibacteraceae bacterium]
MNQREKLIELLNETFEQQYEKRGVLTADHTADFLLFNGVIVPPCKVGDTVYVNTKAALVKEIYAYKITNLMITRNKRGLWTNKYRAMLIRNGKTIDVQENFEFDDIGKTVFLTREEAEAELNKRGATNAKNN